MERRGNAAGEGTRAALEAAAVAAIVDEGWQGASSRSVTARAAVPLGALNYHFGSKEALFRRAAMAEVARMFTTPWRIMQTGTGVTALVEALVGWTRSADVTAVQQALLLEVMAQSRRDPELAGLLEESLAAYRGAVAAALERLGVTDGAGVAAALTAQLNGLWLQAIVEPGLPAADGARRAARVWATDLTG